MDLLKAAGAGALSAALSPFNNTSSQSVGCPQHHTAGRHPRHRRRRLRALVSASAPLPVAGIDAAEAGGALHAVRRALASREGGPKTCDLWLAALCCAQEASDRLLADLDDARRSAAFWRVRMRAGGHGAFMLLGRGPVEFAAGVMGVLSGALLAARKKQRRASLALQDGGSGEDGDADDEATTTTTATDRIQERIDALEALSRRLAAVVAGVHRAADLLRLELAPGTAGADAAAAAVAAAPSAAAMAPSAPLASSDPPAAERAIATCLRRLRLALQDVPVAAAEAARRGERGDEEEEEAAAEASAVAPPSPPPLRRGNATTSSSTSTDDDLAAIVAVLEGCPLCEISTSTAISPDANALFARILPPSRDAADALRRAASSALSRGPLAPAPAWARMPSRLQRHWLRYSLAGACALAVGGWAYRHSSLNGSDDLERWSSEAGASFTGAWRAHVVDPLLAVRRELFATLRDRPSIVSPAEFNEDREALLRMLRAFEDDHRGLEHEPMSAGDDDAPSPAAAGPSPTDPQDPNLMSRGMARVMTSYERELRNPLRNLLAGSLARAVLIQVQRLKLDTEAAMLELDQILRANELSLTLVAAVPSIVIAALLVRGGWRLVVSAVLGAPPDAKREAVGCRMAMGGLERALSAARAAAAAAGEEGAGGGKKKGGGGDDSAMEAAAAVVAVAEGAAVHALHAVFQEASRLHRLRALAGGGGGGASSSSSSPSSSSGRRSGEWPFLREGLVQLARPPLSSPGKLEYHRHLTRTYALFQP
jgi:nuclear-control-of-ATPase protein 2